MYTLLVHPDEPTTISRRVACVEFYRTASELSHVDVYSEAAVSRVHAVSWYTACKNE